MTQTLTGNHPLWPRQLVKAMTQRKEQTSFLKRRRKKKEKENQKQEKKKKIKVVHDEPLFYKNVSAVTY